MMIMKAVKPFFYEGLVFVCPNGSVYREVSREDIVERRDVFSLPIGGLRYATLEHILKKIAILNPSFSYHDGIEYVRHDMGDDLPYVTPTSEFIGTDRAKGVYPDIVYVTPVTMAINGTYTSRTPR